jgi:hypothetical protein
VKIQRIVCAAAKKTHAQRSFRERNQTYSPSVAKGKKRLNDSGAAGRLFRLHQPKGQLLTCAA